MKLIIFHDNIIKAEKLAKSHIAFDNALGINTTPKDVMIVLLYDADKVKEKLKDIGTVRYADYTGKLKTKEWKWLEGFLEERHIVSCGARLDGHKHLSEKIVW